jgi:hypothetical protein
MIPSMELFIWLFLTWSAFVLPGLSAQVIQVNKDVGIISGPCIDKGWTAIVNKSTSKCNGVKILNDFDPVTSRAPVVVSDFLLSLLESPDANKFVEIGAKYGVISQCVAHYATVVAGVEYNKEMCPRLAATGIPTICGNFYDLDEQSLPAADLYYW